MENIFLKRLELKAFEEDSVFSKIEGLNKFNSLNFKKPITFFSGENGTGKSTLLEAIAVNWGLILKAVVLILISLQTILTWIYIII